MFPLQTHLQQMNSARKAQNLKIPNQLCRKIMDCQYQIDTNPLTQQLIVTTTQLYSEAVTFFLNHSDYDENNVKRAQFYQQKIKKLLGRTDVKNCLQGGKVNPRVSQLQKQLEKAKQSAPFQAKRLLQYYKNQSSTQSVLIKKTMEQQNQKLQQRLSIRSKSKSKLTMSSPKLGLVERKLKKQEAQ